MKGFLTLRNSIKLQFKLLLSCGRYECKEKLYWSFLLKGTIHLSTVLLCLRTVKSNILPCSAVSHKQWGKPPKIHKRCWSDWVGSLYQLILGSTGKTEYWPSPTYAKNWERRLWWTVYFYDFNLYLFRKCITVSYAEHFHNTLFH